MARSFLTRKADDDDDHLAEYIASREQELSCYYTNIQLYADQIAAMSDLPDDLEGDLAKFKGKQAEQIQTMGATPEQLDIATRWSWRERLRVLIVTERAECSKSELAYDSLLAALPEGTRRTTALERLALKQAAKVV